MKLVQFLAFLVGVATCSAGDFPVTDQAGLPKAILKPWRTERWWRYSGTYRALEGEGAQSGLVVLTAFAGAKDAKLISACLILVSDLVVEPSYQIHGGISPNEETGELDGSSIHDWRMIRYVDPNTKESVFGISINGTIYVDRSKTKPAEEAEAEDQTE
jgi:hypothetical protein